MTTKTKLCLIKYAFITSILVDIALIAMDIRVLGTVLGLISIVLLSLFYRCPACGFRFPLEKSLKKLHQCPDCHYDFDNEGSDVQ